MINNTGGVQRIESARLLPCVDETVIDVGTMVIEEDLIAWVGPAAELPPEYSGDGPAVPMSVGPR